MSIRLIAIVSVIAVVALASGCAQPGVVHRPLFESSYSGDLVAPRAPPPFIVEQVPLRPGYLWAHSYWRWDGHDYVEVHGHWEAERSGYRYVSAHWEQHRDGWHFRPAAWLSID